MPISQTFVYLQDDKEHFLKCRPFFIKDAKKHRNRLIFSSVKRDSKKITNAHINRFGPPLSTFLETRLSGYLSIVSLITAHLVQPHTWPTYDTKCSQQSLFSRLWCFQLDFLKFTSAREKTWALLPPSFASSHYHSHPLTMI